MPLLLLPPAVDTPAVDVRAATMLRTARPGQWAAQSGYVVRVPLPGQVDPVDFVVQASRTRIASAPAPVRPAGSAKRSPLVGAGGSEAPPVAPAWRVAASRERTVVAAGSGSRSGSLRPDRPAVGYYVATGQAAAAGAVAGQAWAPGVGAGAVVGGGAAP